MVTPEDRLAEPMRRRVIAVIGDAGDLGEERYVLCRELGAALVRAGYRIVTGGLGGVMRAVSEGARRDPGTFDGATIGIVPSYDHNEANVYCDIVIPTGMQVARNVLVVSSADAVVICGGGAGTLSEIALAWQLRKPLFAFGRDGWAGELSNRPIDERRNDVIVPCASVETVLASLAEVFRNAVTSPADIGRGGKRR